MTEFLDVPCPRETPWGHADTMTRRGPGLWAVSTPRHGGLWLSPERLAVFAARFPGWDGWGGLPWLEEDLDCCAGILAFPECFDAEAIFAAAESVATYKSSYTMNAGGYYFGVVRDWLLSPAGAGVKKIADDYRATRQGMWRYCGCCTAEGGWNTFYSRGNERRTVRSKHYHATTWLTDAELATYTQVPDETPSLATV